MRILVVCTGNSARSQMAEGLLRSIGGATVDVHSAGTRPSWVNPLAVEVMKEVGIDISRHRSKSVDEFAGQQFDYVITVCDSARDACPIFPGAAQRVHWSFDDPAAAAGSEEERRRVFRRVRDEIGVRLREFLEGNGGRQEKEIERIRFLAGNHRSEMVVPVVNAPGSAVGLIDVESERLHAFTDRDCVFLKSCASALLPLWT